jgi:hypothetical protein
MPGRVGRLTATRKIERNEPVRVERRLMRQILKIRCRVSEAVYENDRVARTGAIEE